MALTGIGEPLTQMKIRGMRVILSLQQGGGAFPTTGANTKTIYSASLPGYLHIEANINRIPAWQGNTASVVIYGMTTEDCIAATKFNPINIKFYNQIQIYAGYLDGVIQNPGGDYDEDSVIAATNNLPLVFLGQLVSAAPNFNNPNRPFVIQALLMAQALAVINESTNVNSPTNLSTIVNSMITANNGTSPPPQIIYQLNAVYPDTNVNNAHYIGSFAQKLQQICEDYGYQIRISFPNNAIDQNTQLITLTKIGTAPPNAPVQDLNSETGMIGYPEVMPFGIMAREFYNPLRSINDQVNLQTYFTAIAGTYYVWQIQSVLQTHGDLWESTLVLYGFNNSAYA